MNAVVHRGKLDPQAASGATSDVAISQKQLFWRQFRRHRLALVWAAWLCALGPLLIILSAYAKSAIPVMILVIGLLSWMSTARIVRATVLSIRERDFTLAARAVGAPDVRIIARHILPNALAPIIVGATLGVGGAIIAESSLSFLGLGVQVPTPSWGNMLQDSQSTMASRPWLTIFPGMAILITVLGINFLGDGLRDALDPTIRS